MSISKWKTRLTIRLVAAKFENFEELDIRQGASITNKNEMPAPYSSVFDSE
jgi:hypothetical protein